MVVGKFQLLQGAAGDVAELEYISALHQTGPHVRQDASIRAEDIRLFLSSRYGIDVTDEEVKDTIMDGLGGGNDVLDLMEVVACLLIPTFLKAFYQINGMPLPSRVAPTQDDLLPMALKVILHDATGCSSPKAISTDLVRRILVAYGEVEMSEDTELLEEMVDCCGAEAQHLTVEAFGDALSSDLHLLDLENEHRLSTNMNDVFLTKVVESFRLSKTGSIAALRGPEKKSQTEKNKGLLAYSIPLKIKKKLSQIDITAANYRSKPLMILLWATFLINFFTHYFEVITEDLENACVTEEIEGFAYSYKAPWVDNREAILCEILASVVIWFVYFVSMAVLGVVFITLGSTGNSVNCKRWWVPLLGATAVAVPVVNLYASESTGGPYLDIASLVLGLATVCYQLSHAASMAFPSIRDVKYVSRWLATSTVHAEMEQKRSAANKIACMTKNALRIVSSDDESNVFQTYYGKALQTYNKKGEKRIEAGGFIWSWKRILRCKKFSDYQGIWMSARLVASNISQYIVSLWVLIAGISLTQRISSEYNLDDAEQQLRPYLNRTFDVLADEGLVLEATDSITSILQDFLTNNTDQSMIDFGCANNTGISQDFFEEHCTNGNSAFLFPLCERNESVNYLCPLLGADELSAEERLSLLAASGLDYNELVKTMHAAVDQAAVQALHSLYPSEKYMVVIPAAVATAFGFLVALYLSFSYIPSVLNTILKLRSGEIPTFRNPHFFKYRTATDLVAILSGSLFWGAIGSSLVVGGTLGLIVFFFLWQATAYYAQRLVAIVVGMLLITFCRILFLQSQRKKIFRAFYRERPRTANLLLLALEWAYFSLTAGYIVVRMLKLLLCAAACIGRIDTPFLAPGIGRIGPIDLDHYPSVHLQEILSHEAHRHPYIELLGVIYMMKMRYGEKFGTRACSAWRLLFVYALFPWLHQYRVAARPELLDHVEESVFDQVEKPSSLFHATSTRFLNRVVKTQEGPSSSQRHVLASCHDNVEKQSERIRALEQEVKRLKETMESVETKETSFVNKPEKVRFQEEALSSSSAEEQCDDGSKSSDEPFSVISVHI